MKLALKVLLLVMIIPPAAFFLGSIFSIPLVLTGLQHSTVAMLIVELFGVIATIPIITFVLQARVDDTAAGRRTAVRMGAAIMGGASFLGGIAWAEYYWPESDLNFLMGPIAGSAGLIVGALLGYFYWWLVHLNKNSQIQG